MDYRGKRIRSETIVLDGNSYHQCIIENCRVVYRGTTPIDIERTEFHGCEMDLQGPARNTLVFLASMQQSGGANVVDAMFAAAGAASPGGARSSPSTLVTFDNVTVKGAKIGITAPQGTRIDARNSHFEDVGIPVEIRDHRSAENLLRDLGLPPEIKPRDFAELVAQWSKDPPKSDAAKVESIGKFAMAKRWVTDSFSTAGGTASFIANLIKIADSPVGRAAANYIASQS